MTKKKNHKIPFALQVIPTVFPWLERLAPPLARKFFIHLFFTPLRYKTPEKEIEAAASAEKFVVESDGKKIQCYAWGAGVPVLMVHGWAGRGTQFRKFIDPLTTAGYRMVSIDGPAHGLSDGKQTNPEDFSHAIAAVCEKIGKPAAIVAHSFGGIASLNAISKGLEVTTLINIASPTIGDEIVKTYLRTLNGSSKMGEAFKKHVYQKTGKEFNEFTALAFIERVPKDLHLLLVHDSDDKEVSIEHPRALVRKFPSAQFLQTSGLGHNRILKDENVIAAIVTFINSHSSNS